MMQLDFGRTKNALVHCARHGSVTARRARTITRADIWGLHIALLHLRAPPSSAATKLER